jgi:hypothetical protein
VKPELAFDSRLLARRPLGALAIVPEIGLGEILVEGG